MKLHKRLLTQKQKIINALKDAGEDGMTNAELSKISLRYGGHIGNLYREGYKIKKYNLDGGLYKYVFVSEPSNIKYFKNAQCDLLEEIENELGENVSHRIKTMLDRKYYHVVRQNGWYLQDQENC